VGVQPLEPVGGMIYSFGNDMPHEFDHFDPTRRVATAFMYLLVEANNGSLILSQEDPAIFSIINVLYV
jgi:hypothetical protein